MKHLGLIRTALLGCALACASAPGLRAQDAGQARLEALLRELSATPASAWQTRVEGVQKAIAAAGQASKDAIALAKAKTAQAEARETAAKQIDAEGDQLKRLRASLRELRRRDATEGADPARLDKILDDLASVPEEVWDARAHALEESAVRERTAGKALRDDADRSTADSKQKLDEVAALEREIATLARLQSIVDAMRPVAPAQSVPLEKPSIPPAAAPKLGSSGPNPNSMPTGEAPSASQPGLLTYADDVFPIFEANCITCHERGETSGGLDLSSHATALQGGGSGRTIRAGNPEASRLFLLVSHREKPTMPPDEPRIAAASIEAIRLWIEQGAPKDRAEAERFAAERAIAKAKADASAASVDRARAQVESVMPNPKSLTARRSARRAPALRAIAVAPVAPLIALSGVGQVLFLRAEDLADLGALDFPFGQVERLAFSADGKRLLAAGGHPGRSGAAVIYDVATAAILGVFGEQRDVVIGADLSPDGALVAVGGTRRKVEVFEVGGDGLLWDADHDDWVTELRFSPDGSLLAAADRTGRVMVREATSGREVQALSAGEGAVDALAFSPDSRSLATGGADRTLRVFRISDGGQLSAQKVHTDRLTALCWHDPKRLLSAGADGRVLAWRDGGARDRDLPSIGDWVYGLAATGDDRRCLVGDWRGVLRVIDFETRKITACVEPLAVAQ